MPQRKSQLRSILSGAAAGFLATVPMTVCMSAWHRRLPWFERYPLPPRQITMKAAGAVGLSGSMEEDERSAATAIAHFGYGAAMGSVYGLLAGSARVANPGAGIPWGLAVWAGSYLGYLPALGVLPPATEHPVRRTALMVGAHVVWGAALGTCFRWLHGRHDRE